MENGLIVDEHNDSCIYFIWFFHYLTVLHGDRNDTYKNS